jgi:hypothetical protein
MEYHINDIWYVLRQENGSALGFLQVSQLLQVTFTDGVHVSAGKTTVPDALWNFADAIKGNIHASSIAETFFAKDIKKIQAARQKRSK